MERKILNHVWHKVNKEIDDHSGIVKLGAILWFIFAVYYYFTVDFARVVAMYRSRVSSSKTLSLFSCLINL